MELIELMHDLCRTAGTTFLFATHDTRIIQRSGRSSRSGRRTVGQSAVKWVHIALRNMWRAWRRSVLTGAAAAVGAFAILIAVGFVVAALEGIRESTIRGGVGHVHLGLAGAFDGFAERPLQFGLTPDDQDRIEKAYRAEFADPPTAPAGPVLGPDIQW